MRHDNNLKQQKKNVIRASIPSIVFDIFNYTIIVLFCLSIIFPVWDMIVVSFSRAEDVSVIRANLWPKVWDAGAYQYVFSNSIVWTGLMNSAIRTIFGTLYHLIVCCLAAYALTRRQMPFKTYHDNILNYHVLFRRYYSNIFEYEKSWST